MTAIMGLFEDETGDVVLFLLHQQDDEGARKAVDIVDVGTVLLVKEPYFKCTSDGEYALRVDHLSDVVPLSEDSSMIPDAWRPRVTEMMRTAESLKLKGNAAGRSAIAQTWR